MLDELAMRTAVSNGRVLKIQIVGLMRSAENVPTSSIKTIRKLTQAALKSVSGKSVGKQWQFRPVPA